MLSRSGTDSGVFVDAAQTESRLELPDDWPNRSLSRMLQVGQRRWHIQEAGEGARILLLHGTGASTHTWRSILPRLAPDFSVLAVDLPGHAYSGRLAGERLSLEDMSAALNELLEHLNFQPDFVVGHSAGAAVGLKLVLDGFATPRSVIGLNAALLPFGGAWQPLINPLARLFASVSFVPRFLSATARDSSAVRRMLENTGSRIDDEGLKMYCRLMQREDHVAAVLSMMANWNLDRFLLELPGLDCDLQLVTAQDDLAVNPEQAKGICRIVPSAGIVSVEGGHLAHEEYPRESAILIRDLCSGKSPDHHPG